MPKKKRALTDEDRAREVQLESQVKKMAEAIPMDEPIVSLALALVTTMGARADSEKVMLLSTVLIKALKMIHEPTTPTEGDQEVT